MGQMGQPSRITTELPLRVIRDRTPAPKCPRRKALIGLWDRTFALPFNVSFGRLQCVFVIRPPLRLLVLQILTDP